MRAWRSVLAIILTALGLGLGFSAAAAEFQQRKDFLTINPPLATNASQIEVTEFFWYGCPHCFNFEPILGTWLKKLPPDVSFRRVPAIFPNNQWTPGAALYYTLDALGVLETLHGEVFKAIHVERKRLDNEQVLAEWLASKGVDGTKFSETRSSFGVQSRIQQARSLTLASGMTGVPAIMVHGKYLVPTPGTYPEMLKTVDDIVDHVRADVGRKPDPARR